MRLSPTSYRRPSFKKLRYRLGVETLACTVKFKVISAKVRLVYLPHGYRLLRTAPGVWVLVELYSSGAVVARYEGTLDPSKVERDAREHADKKNCSD